MNFNPGFEMPDSGRATKFSPRSAPTALIAQRNKAALKADRKKTENPDWRSLRVGDRVTSPYWDSGVVRTITDRNFTGTSVQVRGLRGSCNARVLFKVKEE